MPRAKTNPANADGAVVTRFAPSPTGHLHAGGARTALFNWALARSQPGGRFLLRMEDTDRARSQAALAESILADLRWLGLDWDGEPVFQSARTSHYQRAIAELLANDLAYPAFETPEELDAMRGKAQGFRYRRPQNWDRAAAQAKVKAGAPHVIRLHLAAVLALCGADDAGKTESSKTELPREIFAVEDQVLGTVEFAAEALDDFVLQRQDGGVTYHLAVVVDDAAQGVTHVLRGQEHLANTPRHQALQRALNLPRPHYAHLPVIQNPDGSKMSKRDREKGIAVNVEDFRRQGVLPEVLLNFLALLGYSPGEKLPDGRNLERFDRNHLLRHFSLARVGRGNARFDRSKLAAFNQDSIAALSPAELKAHWTTWCNRYQGEALSARAQKMSEAQRALFLQALQPRSKSLADLTALDGPGAFALLKTHEFTYGEKAAAKWLRRGAPGETGLERLRELRPLLAALASFDPESIEAAVAGFCGKRGIGLGKAAQPLRVAVTGGASSPPLGLTLAILGQAETTARLDRCLAEIGAAQNSA